jgi:hypothetical protein
MLGALSLPSISTGFTSDNKSMVPVSIQGMADKVEMSLNVHSMEDILMDVRDAIHNTSLAALKSFTMLQETMINGFTMLSNGLMNIGAIANKDLELEETQTNIDIENEEDEDRNESLAGPTGGSFFTDEFKGKFSSALNRMKDLSFVESLIALGAGLALLTFNFDKIASAIGSTVKFFDEQIIPRGKAFISTMAEYGKNLFDGFFGKTGLFTVIFDGLGNINESIDKGDGKAALLAVSDMFIKSTLSIISLAGTSILGLLKVGIKTVNPDADVSKLDKVIQYFNDLPGNAIKKLEADQIEFDKVLEEEGKISAAGVLFRQTYDNYIANLLGGISKTIGFILAPVNEDLSKTMIEADYSFEGITSAFKVSMENLSNAFDRVKDSVRVFSNEIIDSVNAYLPDFMKIPKIPKKDDQFEIDTLASMEKQKLITPEQYEPGGFMYDKYQEQREKVIDIDPSVVIPNNSFEKDFGVDANVGDIIDGTYKMKDKTKEIRTLTNESVVDNDNSSIVAPIFDNKSITTNNSNSQTVTVTDQRVDSMETSSNALLAYFRQ